MTSLLCYDTDLTLHRQAGGTGRRRNRGAFGNFRRCWILWMADGIPGELPRWGEQPGLLPVDSICGLLVRK